MNRLQGVINRSLSLRSEKYVVSSGTYLATGSEAKEPTWNKSGPEQIETIVATYPIFSSPESYETLA